MERTTATTDRYTPRQHNQMGQPPKNIAALRQVLSSPDLRRVLPGLGLSCFLTNILALALPLGILQIVDRVVINQSIETLLFLVIGIVLALIMQVILRTANGLITSWLGTRFEHRTSVAALERLMHVPLQRYQQEEPGVHAERILASSKVAEFYSGEALLVLFDFPFVAVFLWLIYILGGILVAVPTLLLLLFALVIYHYGDWMHKQVEQRNVLDDRRFGFLAEVLSGIHSVKTMSMESLLLRRYERLQETSANLGEVLNRGNSLAANLGSVFSKLMIVGVVATSAWLVINGQMTPGSLAACMMLSVRTLRPLRRGLQVWMRYQSFVAAHKRLNEVINMPYEDDSGKPEMPTVEQGLELRNVTLTHDGGDVLFRGLSLSVKAGESIAIRGGSGSGKTSLLSLMSGFTRPNSGEILVDGLPLSNYTEDSIHKEIALLPQTGTIISGNILENLTMFDTTLNKEALRLAEKLGLGRVVSGMKLGYETPLGGGIGETLPAGVSQIITIIRGLVRNPSVILFDEANISLDMLGDQLLCEYLAEQRGKCTLVMVTHRPSMFSLVDKVYTLDNGRLVEGVIEIHPDTPPQFAALTNISARPERPKSNEDISLVIRRQFEEESDLSICILPLLTSLGWQGQPRELAEAMPHLIRRMELSNLCSTMANIGFFPKHFTSNLARLDHRLLPCLFLPNHQSAKVILKCQPNGNLLIFDSDQRTETEIKPSLKTGNIYLFQKKDVLLKSRQVESTWTRSLMLRFRGHIILSFFLTVAGTMLSLAPPLFVRSIYNWVLPSGDILMGVSLMFGVIIAIAINSLLVLIKGRVMAFVSGRSEYILGNSIFQRIIALPTTSIEGSSISNQVGRVKNLEGLRNFFLGPLSTVAFELPANLVLIIAIGIINPWVLVVVLVSAISFLLLGLFSRKYSEIEVTKSSQLAALRWEFLNEALTEMSSIRSVGAGNSWVGRFREISGKSVMANFNNQKMHARITAIAGVLGHSTGLLSLALSAYLSIIGQITSGTMVATMMIIWRLVGPIQNIFQSATSVVRTRSNIRQIENLMRLKGESDTGVIQTIRPIIQGTLSFARVSFRYANDADPVLLGVSFTLSPGQLVVIAGSNGSGKSTLLKLIERIYIPQAGTIRLDNVDIRQLTATDLRAKISYMPQNCEFFYGTVAQNLRLANPVATDEEIQWAIEMAGLAEDIKALPDGLQTRISNSRSEQLSHGFRQRLSLARTIVKPADLVLLDEPATGMDQAGEAALMRCIEWLRGRSTLIMVSHRPSHMRLTDTVIVMDRGSVVAMGAFDIVKDKIMSVIS
jgi:ATP-binding cassette subfamily B protein